MSKIRPFLLALSALCLNTSCVKGTLSPGSVKLNDKLSRKVDSNSETTSKSVSYIVSFSTVNDARIHSAEIKKVAER